MPLLDLKMPPPPWPSQGGHRPPLEPKSVKYPDRSVKEFNDMILEMVHKNKRLNIIDNFAILSDSYGCLDVNYGRFDKVTHQPYRADVLHYRVILKLP